MTIARAGFALVWSPDGRLFAIGGLDDRAYATQDVEMLECPWGTEEDAAGAWVPVAPMCRRRGLHGACFFDGKLFVAGGKRENTVECFVTPSVDLPMGQWTMVRPMATAMHLLGLLPFGGGLLMVGELHAHYLNLRLIFNCHAVNPGMKRKCVLRNLGHHDLTTSK